MLPSHNVLSDFKTSSQTARQTEYLLIRRFTLSVVTINKTVTLENRNG